MTEQELESYIGKYIKVICVDGDVCEGECVIFTRAVDNEPEVAEIALKTKKYTSGLTAILETEIKSIDVIQ